MQIQQAIIHELKKDKETHGQGSVQIRPRAQLLPIDAVLNGMGEGLLSVYASSVSGYGSLGADTTLHRFPVEMDLKFPCGTKKSKRSHLKLETDFLSPFKICEFGKRSRTEC